MFLQGLFGMVLGFLVLIFRARIKDFTGDIGFAERYLGPGGTWTFFILVGVGLFIFGLMWSMGTLQGLLLGTFGTLLGR